MSFVGRGIHVIWCVGHSEERLICLLTGCHSQFSEVWKIALAGSRTKINTQSLAGLIKILNADIQQTASTHSTDMMIGYAASKIAIVS